MLSCEEACHLKTREPGDTLPQCLERRQPRESVERESQCEPTEKTKKQHLDSGRYCLVEKSKLHHPRLTPDTESSESQG